MGSNHFNLSLRVERNFLSASINALPRRSRTANANGRTEGYRGRAWPERLTSLVLRW